jgi:hypothetical protein
MASTIPSNRLITPLPPLLLPPPPKPSSAAATPVISAMTSPIVSASRTPCRISYCSHTTVSIYGRNRPRASGLDPEAVHNSRNPLPATTDWYSPCRGSLAVYIEEDVILIQRENPAVHGGRESRKPGSTVHAVLPDRIPNGTRFTWIGCLIFAEAKWSITCNPGRTQSTRSNTTS